MKGIFLFISAILLQLSICVHSQGTWRPGEMEIRVPIMNASEAQHLQSFNLTGDIYSQSGYALLYVIPEELERIKSSGFHYEILKTDLNEFAKNFWSSRDQYHSYDEIIAMMDTLTANYPQVCRKIEYGYSVEGRQLAALKISDNVASDEDEAEILFDGGIHGDEIGGPENLVRFAEFLCESYTVNPEITSLINSREIWLYLMVNPDGRVNMVRQNSNGVDLNRDWGYMWKGEGSSPGYYSQVETRALRKCLMENQFVIHTTYHSGDVFLAYPWSYRPDSVPDRPHIYHLAGIYADSSGYPALPYEQGYTGMYPINGSSKDASYGGLGSIAWTMEISQDKQPPPSEIQYFYDINKPAMIAMIEQAGFGIRGTVMDADTGIPVAATIFINNFYPFYNDPVVGDYHKYLMAGSYSVTAIANGYQPATQIIDVYNDSVVTLDFALQPEYYHYAYRIIACHMPSTNFYDEARTSAALSAPDGINYSTGRSGWVILDMQAEIPDGPAEEITVHEGDSEPESFFCYAAVEMDGPWFLLGGGTGTASFDFSASGLDGARYIRITDDGDGQATGDNAGFDLDAVEVLQQSQVIYLVADCFINDSAGNLNQRIDPGENFTLVVTLRNLGNMPLNGGEAYLNFDPEYVSFIAPEQPVGSLSFGDSLQLEFTGGCSSFCPMEEILMTVMNIISDQDNYQESFPLNFTAGAIVEDFETGGLTKFDWEVTGDKPWAINFQDPFQGSFSARSGNIDDNQVSALEITLDVIGYDDISFSHKVSSEDGSDFLRFYIDNNLFGQWSGSQPWESHQYQVKPGIHTFKWSFEKDNANSAGSDGGWIDYIVFPSCNLDGTLKVLANAIPHKLCGTGESQLGAYFTGGSGEVSFFWTPSSTLNDSTIQFPLAFPEFTTNYTVTVNDGEGSASSVVQINLFTVPDSPVVVQEGDSLISSVVSGNQWFDTYGPVTGETGQVFYPPAEGDYYAMVYNEDGCRSDTSNIIYFIFTGIGEEETGIPVLIYPNPFDDLIQVQFLQKPETNITIRITDILGNQISEFIIPVSAAEKIINLRTKGLVYGLYLISVLDKEDNILNTKKLIKR